MRFINGGQSTITTLTLKLTLTITMTIIILQVIGDTLSQKLVVYRCTRKTQININTILYILNCKKLDKGLIILWRVQRVLYWEWRTWPITGGLIWTKISRTGGKKLLAQSFMA